MTTTVTYQIAWRTRDRRLINRVCAYLGVRPYMSVNRTTPVGTLTDEQLQALQPLADNGSISLRRYTK